jgi:hypothetical protein
MGGAAFSSKLQLVLKALSISRGRLAAELGVDKSLAGRWYSGAVRPASHNMERLTRFVAEHRPGFSLLDWERDIEDLADLFEVTWPPRPDAGPSIHGIPLPGLETARLITAHRGDVYEGFWRSTRPAVVAPGRFCHDHGLFRRGPSGLLEFVLGNPDLRFVGWAMPFEGQLFVIASDPTGIMPSFVIVNGVPMPKAVLLDGIILTAFNALRVPAAYPIILERVGDLTGDREMDDATLDELMAANEQFAPEGSVPAHIVEHLLRDVGPAAAALGGDLLLTASRTSMLSHRMAEESVQRTQPA